MPTELVSKGPGSPAYLVTPSSPDTEIIVKEPNNAPTIVFKVTEPSILAPKSPEEPTKESLSGPCSSKPMKIEVTPAKDTTEITPASQDMQEVQWRSNFSGNSDTKPSQSIPGAMQTVFRASPEQRQQTNPAATQSNLSGPSGHSHSHHHGPQPSISQTVNLQRLSIQTQNHGQDNEKDRSARLSPGSQSLQQPVQIQPRPTTPPSLQNLLGKQFADVECTPEALVEALKLKTEQEKTKQEFYRLETRKRSLELLNTAMRVGVPIGALPLIFGPSEEAAPYLFPNGVPQQAQGPHTSLKPPIGGTVFMNQQGQPMMGQMQMGQLNQIPQMIPVSQAQSRSVLGPVMVSRDGQSPTVPNQPGPIQQQQQQQQQQQHTHGRSASTVEIVNYEDHMRSPSRFRPSHAGRASTSSISTFSQKPSAAQKQTTSTSGAAPGAATSSTSGAASANQGQQTFYSHRPTPSASQNGGVNIQFHHWKPNSNRERSNSSPKRPDEKRSRTATGAVGKSELHSPPESTDDTVSAAPSAVLAAQTNRRRMAHTRHRSEAAISGSTWNTAVKGGDEGFNMLANMAASERNKHDVKFILDNSHRQAASGSEETSAVNTPVDEKKDIGQPGPVQQP